jgi:tetratricopeptide (TPR) repeat protein
MPKVTLILLAAITLSSCSSTQLVYLSVKEPAPVSLPSYIKNVGIINRTQPTSASNKIIDKIDRALSLEGKNLDKDGAKASIEGLTTELQKDGKFDEVKFLDPAGLKTVGLDVFPASLSWDEVERICRENKMDALFALEVFDTDSKLSYAANPVNINVPVVGNVPGIEHQANMLTVVKTGWRIYDPSGKNILDEYAMSRQLSFSGKGINPVAAASAVMNRNEAVKEVANQAGQAYAMRIIPFWIRVNRDYYVRGTDNFVIAKRKAQTGNWDEAGKLWEKETSSSDRKVAGRACYNMAIINEINGNLDAAIKWAQRSYENYNNKLALHYVNILKNRQIKDDIVQNQTAQ